MKIFSLDFLSSKEFRLIILFWLKNQIYVFFTGISLLKTAFRHSVETINPFDEAFKYLEQVIKHFDKAVKCSE